jgi:Siphovirus ReqiPepy6 Gp37-like protein
MEWFTLDDEFRKDELIEGFESFIWAERYSAFGDFQIVIKASYSTRMLLRTDKWIGMTGSNYVMKIETVKDSTDDAGIRNLTVSGRSMESLLLDRVPIPGMGGIYDLTGFPVNTWAGQPADIVREMFQSSCVAGFTFMAKDIIPFYHAGTLLPPGSIPEPNITGGISVITEYESLYDTIKKFCDIYEMGFRLIRNGEMSEVYFEVYMGSDRTSSQTVNDPVIFTPNMENLANSEILKSSAIRKTVAYVFAKNDSMEVYAPDADQNATGFERRVLFVRAEDIDLPDGAALTAAMQQKGTEELAKNRQVYTFDGEIPQFQPYIYGGDYFLGDHVEERDSDGNVNTMMVTEQIFISDSEGERSYPTLSLHSFAAGGTWSTRPIDEHWADIPLTEHWADE